VTIGKITDIVLLVSPLERGSVSSIQKRQLNQIVQPAGPKQAVPPVAAHAWAH
jgi:hypothetical protein